MHFSNSMFEWCSRVGFSVDLDIVSEIVVNIKWSFYKILSRSFCPNLFKLTLLKEQRNSCLTVNYFGLANLFWAKIQFLQFGRSNDKQQKFVCGCLCFWANIFRAKTFLFGFFNEICNVKLKPFDRQRDLHSTTFGLGLFFDKFYVARILSVKATIQGWIAIANAIHF